MNNDNATGLVFEDPPPKNPGGYERILTPEILHELKANPGQWARIPGRVSASLVNQWKKRNPGLDATTRNVDQKTRKATIYVRWVGEDA